MDNANTPNDCLGICAFGKSGRRLSPESRSAVTFATLVTLADGTEYAGEPNASKHMVIAHAARVLRTAGRPSTWPAGAIAEIYREL